MQETSARQTGFTLLELMVTVAIAATVMGLAIPSFNTTIKNSRLTSQVNDFIASLNIARSEAVKRGVPVTLCKSSDGLACVTTGDWAQGWMVFTNENNNTTYDPLTETLLRVKGSAQSQITMIAQGASSANTISYLSSGMTGALATIKLCDDRVDAVGKNIVFATTGRARINSGISCP